MTETNKFKLDLEVRDYECDIQGIVNNSVYQNYLEHARHKYLQFIGLDFAQLHEEGKDAVVTRAEVDYKSPLKSGDQFYVLLSMTSQGRLRVIFNQSIYRKSDNQLIVDAKIFAAVIENNRPIPIQWIVDKANFNN